MSPKTKQSYYDLMHHNFAQIYLFVFAILVFFSILFLAALPILKNFFEAFLQGKVYNTTGNFLSYSLDKPLPEKGISYFFSWAIDIYKDTPAEARYWFNPFLSLIFQLSVFSFVLATLFTTVLPNKFGFIRQKIDREILNFLNKISLIRYGLDSGQDREEIIKDILSAEFNELKILIDEIGMTFEDIIILQKALVWQRSSFLFRIFHINDGIQVYMRFYFTVKFGNTTLGLVYMGASILIIIIGLRGLKFIPPSEPSLVLFALGLEFTLLVTYAVTLMYTRQDDSQEFDKDLSVSKGDNLLLGGDFGSSKDIEKLLRVFIKSKRKK